MSTLATLSQCTLDHNYFGIWILILVVPNLNTSLTQNSLQQSYGDPVYGTKIKLIHNSGQLIPSIDYLYLST